MAESHEDRATQESNCSEIFGVEGKARTEDAPSVSVALTQIGERVLPSQTTRQCIHRIGQYPTPTTTGLPPFAFTSSTPRERPLRPVATRRSPFASTASRSLSTAGAVAARLWS